MQVGVRNNSLLLAKEFDYRHCVEVYVYRDACQAILFSPNQWSVRVSRAHIMTIVIKIKLFFTLCI